MPTSSRFASQSRVLLPGSERKPFVPVGAPKATKTPKVSTAVKAAPATGRIRVRLVEVNTESYEVARSYMTRLEPQDFEEPALSRLAACVKLSAAAFKDRFLPVVHATTALPRMALGSS